MAVRMVCVGYATKSQNNSQKKRAMECWGGYTLSEKIRLTKFVGQNFRQQTRFFPPKFCPIRYIQDQQMIVCRTQIFAMEGLQRKCSLTKKKAHMKQGYSRNPSKFSKFLSVKILAQTEHTETSIRAVYLRKGMIIISREKSQLDRQYLQFKNSIE